MNKLFISQPMKDRTDKEILKERNEIIALFPNHQIIRFIF